jgi:hypothetical protein
MRREDASQEEPLDGAEEENEVKPVDREAHWSETAQNS